MTKTIDINADVGEGVDNESQLFPFLSSCNIACGGHAGNENTIADMIELAKKHQVKIGAHPSYPDKENFGRTAMNITEEELTKTIQLQVNSVAKQTSSLHHIKPHGALYNELAKNEELSKVFLTAISDYKNVFLYVPPKSVIEKMALENGFKVQREAFIDRSYHQNLQLVSRKEKDAVLHEPNQILEQVINIFEKKRVKCIEGSMVAIQADTYCIHGDNPKAIQILTFLNTELNSKGIYIEK